VVGYVQSGKTLSFTTVAALANDNGYGLVIVIAGTTNELAEQSRKRLNGDLAIEDTAFPGWRHFHNPSESDLENIRNVLRDRRDPATESDERQAVVVSVIKNHKRLKDLVALIRSLGEDAAVPALIIDDEADQASFNTLVRSGQLSPTYRRLNELRAALPHHSFLQYTATPQANLLINIIDALSPDFAVVLEPGAGYTGGMRFFAGNSPLTRLIPASDLPVGGQSITATPESLQLALAIFYLGVASGRMRRTPANRSMLIHPSHQKAGHQDYYDCVRATQNNWIGILDRVGEDEDKADLLAVFKTAYDDLSQTVPDLESFDQLAKKLLQAIRKTETALVNSQPEARRKINFKSNYSWILVGGNVMDRGYTIEGLTVTYMPRGPGTGNADTIQQRARFFGYKESYLGFCRVFLEPAVLDAYTAYIRHEENVRDRLRVHLSSGEDLRTFKRTFLLEPGLRPTRQNILDLAILRPRFAGGWSDPKSPHEDVAAVEANRLLVEEFIATCSWHEDAGNAARTAIQRHNEAVVPLRTVYDQLLVKLKVPNIEDSAEFSVALMILADVLADSPAEGCTVYCMSKGLVRERSAADGRVDNFFQGANPRDGSIYPGDREIHGQGRVAVQIHRLDIKDTSPDTGTVTIRDVPAVLIWIDGSLVSSFITQPQNSL
jgi:hypothetical protein